MADVGLDLITTVLLVNAVSSNNNGETAEERIAREKAAERKRAGRWYITQVRPDTVAARTCSFMKSAETTVDVPPEPDEYTQVWSTWTGEAKHSFTIERDLEANNILVVDGIGRPVNGRYEVIGSRNSMRMWRKVGWNGPY